MSSVLDMLGPGCLLSILEEHCGESIKVFVHLEVHGIDANLGVKSIWRDVKA